MSKPVNILGTVFIASIADATIPPVARARTQTTEPIRLEPITVHVNKDAAAGQR
jgi:hypothetical protein